jgi:hypothetical protein
VTVPSDVILRIRAARATASTTFSVDLLTPLD